jgi:ATP-binding cassette subfamily F protein 3
VLSGGERSRVALVCMLLRPANFLILDEPTNHLDMQSQDVLQRALIDYPGSVLIVSHNRSFLDPLVDKTLEFRPGEQPRLFSGNIAYYLEKISEETGVPKNPSPSAEAGKPQSAGSRKDQRRQEAEAREMRNKLLKPLESELEILEGKIAELEAAQVALTAALSNEEIAADPEKFREATNAVAKITTAMENSYTRWGVLSDEIEKVKAKLGI